MRFFQKMGVRLIAAALNRTRESIVTEEHKVIPRSINACGFNKSVVVSCGGRRCTIPLDARNRH